jgi:hypothetical protein
MIATDEDALICDLAETYHIYDYRSLSPRMAAIFSCGLRDDSRIKLALAGSRYPLDTLLNVLTYDAVSWLRWAQSKDAHDGGEPPERLYDALLGLAGDTNDNAILTFDSPEAFEAAREMILKGGV